MAAEKKIDADVLAAIDRGSWVADGLGFAMPQMDPKLFAKVKKVLEALGGKWSRSSQSTLFADEDAVTSLMLAAETGVYVDLKKQFQFFETPPWLADRMVDVVGVALGWGAEVPYGCRVLEPSAGGGRLVAALNRRGVKFIDTVDFDARHMDGLRAMPNVRSSRMGDFLRIDVTPGYAYDAVVMNPPFSKGQDMAHVQHAYTFLKPGGVLVAVMSVGFTFRSDKKTEAFRGWLESLPKAKWERLPSDAFKDSGTAVNTVLLVIRKD